MIKAPYPIAPRLGPLPPPDEDELRVARPQLQQTALALPWAAERLAVEPARLHALARSGELLVIPGPWPMRQAYPSGLGYFVPAWQFALDTGAPCEALPALLEAAADRGWTSLDLHRFMTSPLGEDAATPADLLRTGEAERALALVRGDTPLAEVAGHISSRQRAEHDRSTVHNREVGIRAVSKPKRAGRLDAYTGRCKKHRRRRTGAEA